MSGASQRFTAFYHAPFRLPKRYPGGILVACALDRCEHRESLQMRLGRILLMTCGIALATACGSAGDSDIGVTADELCSAGGLVSDDADNIAPSGTLVTWTGSASCALPNPEFQFWQKPPGGSWTIAQPWSTASTHAWNTSVAGAHDWVVWVRESGSSGSYETYRSGRFTVFDGALCSGASLSGSPPSPIGVSTPVTLTGSASCGASTAEYQFWHLPPGGSWTVLQSFSTTATTNWTPTVAGQHSVLVWVRAQGSPNTYDTYKSLGYSVVTSSPCSAGGLSASPTSPSPVGTIVGITGSAASCASPEFKFWVRPSAGAWELLQDWTSNAVYNWNTAARAPGSYDLIVYARQSGSAATYETYGSGTYTLSAATTGAVQTIGSGYNHSCQLLPAGTARCWGYNANGQLGNGTTVASTVPVSVTGISSGTEIVTGHFHNCALDGGSPKCWGSNLRGQIGNGTNTDATTAVAVLGGLSATSLSAGAAHTCAALTNGTVRCWGYNAQGALGDGTVVDKSSPASAVSGITTATRVTAGYYHSCALLSDGTVRCWGGNGFGQLGDGTTTNSLTPVAVSGLSGVVAIGAGTGSTCAVLSDGTGRCWGSNNNGVLGDGSTTNSSVPVTVSGLSQSTGIRMGPTHSCATISDGTARCWGWNVWGELGDGTTTDSLTPVVVSGVTSAESIGSGWHHSCVALPSGAAQCWGYNGNGQLGDGTVVAKSTAVTIP